MPAGGRTTGKTTSGKVSARGTSARGTSARGTSSRGRGTAQGKSAAGQGASSKGPARVPRTRTRAELAELAASVRGATVYLAEKHSIALALADVLPGSRSNLGGCIRCGENAVITWLSGHLLELAPPEAYNAELKSWRRDMLPIVPDAFRLLARTDKGAAAQLEVVKALLSACPSAVNAADFDREGQLLVDEVLELVNYAGPVQRLQTRALDTVSLRRELGRMRPNNDFAGMREAARARSRLDWLAGMNLTRAMTIHGRACGAQGVLSLGRVQTPTLALIVARDLEIENFVPKPFYKLSCPFALPAGELVAKLVTSADMPGCDEEKRLVDREEALKIAGAVSGQTGTVAFVEKKQAREQAPLPYNLTELQKEASARFGLGAQTTLQACQRMYEAKFISYPRTDCQYLPTEQLAEAPQVLAAVGAFEGMDEMVAACDAQRVSPAWNTSKVTAHHAIIPTTEAARGLSQAEAKVYTLICRRYAWQFLPPHVFFKSRVDIECEGYLWRANGRKEVEPGWTEFRLAGPALAKGRARDDEAKDVLLPNAEKGEEAHAGDVQVDEAMTTPPARFTEGTLVDAMENVQRYLKGASADDQKILKKTEGLGTVATRAGIIETLFDRGYIEKEGKAIVSTGLGRDVVRNSPDCIKDPLMTANMERSLSEIQEGRLDADEYVASYASSLPEVIDSIFATRAVYTDAGPAKGAKSGRGAKSAASSVVKAGEGEHACPLCGRALVLRKSARGPFWGCSGFPSCRAIVEDKDGEPDFSRVKDPSQGTANGSANGPANSSANSSFNGTSSSAQGGQGQGEHMTNEGNGQDRTCPRCGKPLVQRTSARGPFWGCSGFPACRYIARDTDAAPQGGTAQGGAAQGGTAPSPSGPMGGQAQMGDACPRCGRPLVLRKSARGPFWGCSGFPSCRYTRDAAEETGKDAGPNAGSNDAWPSQADHGTFPGAAVHGEESALGRFPQGRSQQPPSARSSTGTGRAGSTNPQAMAQGSLLAFGEASRAGEKAGTAGSAGQESAGANSADANVCPRCGRGLVLRKSARGPFWGCSGFPACRYTRDAANEAGRDAGRTGGLGAAPQANGQGAWQGYAQGRGSSVPAGTNRTQGSARPEAPFHSSEGGPDAASMGFPSTGASSWQGRRGAAGAAPRTAFEESAAAMTHDLDPNNGGPYPPDAGSAWACPSADLEAGFQSMDGWEPDAGGAGGPGEPAYEPPFEDMPWDEEAEAQYEEWARTLEQPDESDEDGRS